MRFSIKQMLVAIALLASIFAAVAFLNQRRIENERVRVYLKDCGAFVRIDRNSSTARKLNQQFRFADPVRDIEVNLWTPASTDAIYAVEGAPRIGAQEVDAFATLPGRKRINLYELGDTDHVALFEALSSVAGLESLTLGDFAMDQPVDWSMGFRDLRFLILRGLPHGPSRLNGIAKLPRLEKLSISSVDDADIATLRDSKIQVLRVVDSDGLSSSAFMGCFQLPYLRELKIDSTDTEPPLLAESIRCLELQDLDVSVCIQLGDDEIGRLIAGLPRLQRLDISLTGVTDAFVSVLNGHPNIVAVNAENCPNLSPEAYSKLKSRFQTWEMDGEWLTKY